MRGRSTTPARLLVLRVYISLRQLSITNLQAIGKPTEKPLDRMHPLSPLDVVQQSEIMLILIVVSISSPLEYVPHYGAKFSIYILLRSRFLSFDVATVRFSDAFPTWKPYIDTTWVRGIIDFSMGATQHCCTLCMLQRQKRSLMVSNSRSTDWIESSTQEELSLSPRAAGIPAERKRRQGRPSKCVYWWQCYRSVNDKNPRRSYSNHDSSSDSVKACSTRIYIRISSILL